MLTSSAPSSSTEPGRRDTDDSPHKLSQEMRPHLSAALQAQPSVQSWFTVQVGYQFMLWLIPAVEKFPRAQKFLLGDRIQAAALDVQESLMEATYTRDRQGHLMRANLSLEKLRYLLRLASDSRILDLKRYEFAASLMDCDEWSDRIQASNVKTAFAPELPIWCYPFCFVPCCTFT
jgi:hypothetical protein